MKTRQNVLLSRTKDKSDKEQAFNAMLMLRRKDNKNPATEQIDIHEEINDMSYEANDDSQLLCQLINELSEENGMIIRAHLDGFTYKEIADMTNLKEGTIAMRITRIKLQLKEMFKKESKEDI